jgi:hypothetical protein
MGGRIFPAPRSSDLDNLRVERVMATEHPEITQELAEWIEQQHLFFVATAPLTADGMVNCSPKGLNAFAILDPHSVAYLDLTGSGAETIAHLRENGRIVIMFCAFEGAPQIVRLHGRGSAIFPDDPAFAELLPRFPAHPGIRSIIRVDVTRVSDSCGHGVPQYAYKGERVALLKWAEKKGPEGIEEYQAKHNRVSLDGLPAVVPAKDRAGEPA